MIESNGVKKIGLAVLFSASLILVSSVFATPRKYVECSVGKSIKNPNSAQGYYFDESCKKAYVLPPSVGKVVVSGYVSSVFDGECSVVDSYSQALEAIKSMEDGLRAWSENYMVDDKEVIKLGQKIKKKKMYLGRWRAKLQKAQAELEFALEEGDESYISFLTEEVNDARIKVRGYEIDVSALEVERSNYISMMASEDMEYQRKKAELERERTRKFQSLNVLRDDFAGKSGGQIGIQFHSKQIEMVEHYKKLNRGVDIEFVPMPIEKGVINLEIVKDGKRAGLPLILQSRINGLATKGSGNGLLLSELGGAATANSSNVFGQAVGGEVVINKLGACLLRDKIEGDDQGSAGERIATLIQPTVHFKYGVQVERKISVKYEESHFYQKIKKLTKSKSGLFKTNSVNSLTEKSEAEKWIQIQIESEDDRHRYGDSERIAMDIRREYADSLLMRAAKGYLTYDQVSSVDPGESGAKQGAAVIRKNCKHAYCQMGAAVLDLGDALFGGSTSEANMTKIVKAKSWEKLSDLRMVSGFGTQVFKVEE